MSKTLTPGALRAIARGLDDRKIALNKRATELDDREAELERLKHEHVGQYLEVFGNDPATMLKRYRGMQDRLKAAEQERSLMVEAYATSDRCAKELRLRVAELNRISEVRARQIQNAHEAQVIVQESAAFYKRAFIGMSAAALVMSGLFGLSFAGLI